MASISSLSSALSGLRAAQAGLSVTGHNVSNSSVAGYTRQQAMQKDSFYRNLGGSPIGSLKNQAGLGTSVSLVRQLRNTFYDANYRDENSQGNFLSRKYVAGEEINSIIGELNSEYKAQNAINGIWVSVNELIKDPGAIETRATFIQSAVTFLDRMKDINRNLFDYQMNLNEQVKGEVDSINSITEKIVTLNSKIEIIEADGTSANDLRDERNLLIDELSGYLDIEVKEKPGISGRGTKLDIYVNGQELIANNVQTKIGLRYVSSEYPFYEPVFTNSKEVLPSSADASPLFSNLGSEDLSSNSDNAKGSLKGLLISRGNLIADFSTDVTDPQQVGNFLIPKVQNKIDKLVHKIVTLLNDAVTPNAPGGGPFDLNGNPGIPIFVRKSGATGAEDPTDKSTLFTTDNIEINPELLTSDGYNRLAFSVNGDINDTSILEQISKDWKEPSAELENSSIDGYYKKIITDFAVEIQDSRQRLEAKISTIDLANNKRLSISAVSLDEELTNMLKYQHAYNSAAKIINIIDGMMDKVINGTGRAGL